MLEEEMGRISEVRLGQGEEKEEYGGDSSTTMTMIMKVTNL
jgi:hypothetical protein